MLASHLASTYYLLICLFIYLTGIECLLCAGHYSTRSGYTGDQSKVFAFMGACILVGKAHDKHTIKQGHLDEAKGQAMTWKITAAGWSGMDFQGRLSCTES